MGSICKKLNVLPITKQLYSYSNVINCICPRVSDNHKNEMFYLPCIFFNFFILIWSFFRF